MAELLTPKHNIVSLAARGLHYRGRRRATGGPTGCAHPISLSGSHRARHFNPEGAMTWTKPEAEIVAVTMEVTAYVATL
jgi:coenzyme PQQ precursor peptide PqqA